MLNQKGLEHWEYVHNRLPGEVYFKERYSNKKQYLDFIKEFPNIYIAGHHESGYKKIIKHKKRIVSNYKDAERYIIDSTHVINRNPKQMWVVGVDSPHLLYHQVEMFIHPWSYYRTTDDNTIFYNWHQLTEYVKYRQDDCDIISLELTRF